MRYQIHHQFAAAHYNCGAYGAGDYNETSCSTGTSTTDGNTAGSPALADTGMNMFLLLGIGVVLVVGSALYLFRSLRKAKQ